ncbi:MAG TPA: AAA family ATPase [Nocardioides sp.]|uniref:AAA family ATPase n=1 Tax=uncultured Nocardioides sp. TaxID=198441 RepID=UPI0026261552|nr:AAA family ATPase [uncultured Nocardioides sp.]HRD63549.1 AAA family ATPase [Nocardioides sp.]HRK46646.1 AAA family ATPase [Nocardioides sp.]
MTAFELYRPDAVPSAEASGGDRPGESEPEPLAADAELDVTSDESAQRVAEVLATLDAELVGLAPVKGRVREIASLLLVDRARRRFGLATSPPTLHMSFTGGPGTGKTTVALRMAEILHALGYLRAARVHTVTRDDLVGQFIGHTAPKTKEAIARAAGGVLFIDEAYYLFRPENERDYGQEVIEILLTEMENGRGDLVVVFAGYADRMATFFSANPGLSSRVPHHISFEDYTHEELVDIAELMVVGENFRFSDGARSAFDEYLDLRMAQPRFSNARSVRNAIERSRLRQARRLVELRRPLTREDLVTLTEEDVRGSSVFDARS